MHDVGEDRVCPEGPNTSLAVATADNRKDLVVVGTEGFDQRHAECARAACE
jgi:hypothetical protein